MLDDMFGLGNLDKKRPQAATPKGCHTRPGQECAGLPLEAGCKALAALRTKSEQNPWWAVVSAIMHAGQITYGPQQKYVDRIADPARYGAQPHLAMLDWETCLLAVEDAQLWPSRAAMLRVGAKVFDRHTKGDPQRVLEPRTRSAFVDELKLRLRTDGRIELAALTLKVPMPTGRMGWRMALPFVHRAHAEALKGDRLFDRKRRQASLFGLGRTDVDDGLDPSLDDGQDAEALLTPKEVAKHPLIIEAKALAQRGYKVLYGNTGMGEKAGALLLEYLGDTDAVAADRHVSYWAFRGAPGKRGGLLKKPYAKRTDGQRRGESRDTGEFERGDDITEEMFDRVVGIVRRAAARCGVEPAALQVAAWAWGVCTTEKRRRDIYLFEGMPPLNCAKAFGAQSAVIAQERQRTLF